MKKNFYLAIFAFVTLFTFSGCIDFLEDITYHKNGSGTYQFTMNAGAIKEMMDSFGGSEDQPEEMGQMKEMTKSFDEVQEKLKSIPGVSAFKKIEDTTNYVFGFAFDFKDASILNKAIQTLEKEKTNGTIFSGKKRLLVRSNQGGMANLFKDEMSGGEDENAEMVKSMFGDMKLRTVYHFDRKVKSASNPNALISNNKKDVTIDYYFFKPEKNKGAEGVGSTFKLKCW